LGLDPRMSIVDRISTLTADIRHYMTILTGINSLVGFVDTRLTSSLKPHLKQSRRNQEVACERRIED
jgi:hypothetical protein